MALALDAAQHVDEVVAGQCEGEGADLVAPEHVAGGEPQDEQQPGKIEEQARTSAGRADG